MRRDRDHPTIDDVAAAAKVAKSTVSKAFADRPGACDLSPEMVQRIRRVAADLGWEPNRRKQAAARKRSDVVALVYASAIPHHVGTYEGVLDQLGACLEATGRRLVCVPAFGPADAWMRHLFSLQADGVVISAPVPDDLPGLLRRFRQPMVVINHRCDQAIDQLHPDDQAGGRKATEHLLSLGHRRVAFFSGRHPGHPSELDRLTGYEAAMNAAGLSTWVIGGMPGDAAKTLLRQQPRPSAGVFYNFRDAIETVEILRWYGFRVPQELAMISCDDTGQLADFAPPISAVRFNLSAACDEAIRLLDWRIRGHNDPPVVVPLPVELVIRATSLPG